MLRVNNIDVYRGRVKVLKAVSVEVNEGELVTIIGANGAGKTTLLMTLSGLIKPTRGTVEFLGTRIDEMRPREILKLGIAQVPQGGYIFPRMTVLENLELGACQAPSATVKEMLLRAYSNFEVLFQRRRQRAGTLSGGERQMLAIGRALMSAPRLLMLDEPSIGLSPVIAEEVVNMLVGLQKEGLTILLVEQNVHVALNIADRGCILQSGVVIASDKASNLLENAVVKKAYLGI